MMNFLRVLVVGFSMASFAVSNVNAGDAAIVFVDVEKQGATWNVAVTLRHADDGWDHYADQWRLVSAEGEILGTRILHHPHVDEQPFKRNLSDVRLPPVVRSFYVEAHDSVHGWNKDRVFVDLTKVRGDRFWVQ